MAEPFKVCSRCFCSCSGLVASFGNGSPSVQTTVTTGAGNGQHGAKSSKTGATGISRIATATTQPTTTPQPTATATATATPTPRPQPQPTATPKPSRIPGAVNCNPWGYTSSGGSYNCNPPGSFCAYFSCINNFWNRKGYVMECHEMACTASLAAAAAPARTTVATCDRSMRRDGQAADDKINHMGAQAVTCLSAFATYLLEHLCRFKSGVMIYTIRTAPKIDSERILMARDNWAE